MTKKSYKAGNKNRDLLNNKFIRFFKEIGTMKFNSPSIFQSMPPYNIYLVEYCSQ